MKTLTADPSGDVRDRIAASSDTLDYLDKIWFHKTAAAVIDADRCVQCGACIAACPSNSIGIAADLRPTLTRMCTGCSFCWDVCPLAGLRVERLWKASENGAGDTAVGPYESAHSARTPRPPAGIQDGGVVTALLCTLLEQGQIDGVILAGERTASGGSATVARTPEEVIAGAGSVYNSIMTLAALSDLRDVIDADDRLALVATPCQVNGLRAMQRYPWPYRSTPVDQVVLTIGLFCTRSFDLERLQVMFARRNVDPSSVARIEVTDGELRAFDTGGSLLVDEPVSGFDDAALGGCAECGDSTGRLADISVGSVGSEPGWTSVLVRTAAGAEAWRLASPYLHVEPLKSGKRVQRFAAAKRKRAIATLKRPFDLNGRLLVTYSEHLAAYNDTDRAPVTPPGHRSHHYLISC
jgi:coenzyme F420 hydrogenase subunit beta